MNGHIFDELYNTSEAELLRSQQFLGTNIDVTRRQPEGMLEITLNLPPRQTKGLDESEIRQKYLVLYAKMKCYFINNIADIIDSSYTFEHCANGKIHLHAWYQFLPPPIYNSYGLVEEMARIYLTLIRRKYRDIDLLREYPRYKCAPICIQYTFPDQQERQQQWKQYIIKTH